jgi:type IV pilus assembly protein PilN
MSTTEVLHVDPVPADHGRRPVLIRADLLPPEIVEHRRGRTARTIVLIALAVLMALLGAAYSGSLYQTHTARDALALAEDEASRTQGQQNRYADLVAAQAETKQISTALGTLLADDVRWATVLGNVRGAVPGGVTLGTVAATVNDATTARSGSGAVALPDHSGHRLVGRLTITGTAGKKPDVAAYADALAKINGVTGVIVLDTNATEHGMTFTIQTDLTDVVLGGRFTATTSGSGAK